MSGKRQCSPVARGVLVSVTPVNDPPLARTLLPATVQWGNSYHPCAVLVDSGAEGNFMDSALAAKWGLPTTPLQTPLTARALNGAHLALISLTTVPVSLIISGNHREEIVFYLLESPCNSIVLGHPWLIKHNPHIEWAKNSVLSWSPFCLKHCLGAALSPGSVLSVSRVEAADLLGVPVIYHDLRLVFSKSRAISLPPHRPYDCAINLLPGTSPPRGRLYSLSGPERVAMDKYISDSLAAGLIRSSSSPAGAGFFFVEKKDGSLRPCIDYRGLNDITIKNRYPLPLMSSAFELLQGAGFFTKLDLRNAYHLVRKIGRAHV